MWGSYSLDPLHWGTPAQKPQLSGSAHFRISKKGKGMIFPRILNTVGLESAKNTGTSNMKDTPIPSYHSSSKLGWR